MLDKRADKRAYSVCMQGDPVRKRVLPFVLSLFIVFSATYAQTLKEELAKLGVDKVAGLPDADPEITSFDSLLDGDDLLLAYYHKVDPTFLPSELRLLLIRKTSGRSQQTVIGSGDVAGFPEGGLGSVTRIHATRSYFFVGGHLSPSSAPTLVLTRTLKPVRILPGWVVGLFDDESLVFEHNEPHGSGIYELYFHDSRTGRSRRIYPPEHGSPLLESYKRRITETFNRAVAEGQVGKRYFPSKSGEWGSVVAIDKAGSLAFRLVFDETIGWEIRIWQRFMAFDLLQAYLHGEKMTEPYRDKFDVLISNLKRDYLMQEAIAGIEDEGLRTHLSTLAAHRDSVRFGMREAVLAIDPAWGNDEIWDKLKKALVFPPDSTQAIYIYPRLTTGGPLHCYEFTRDDFEQRFGPSSFEHPLDPAILQQLAAKRAR